MRAEAIQELMKDKNKKPPSNLTSDNWKAMKSLKKDDNIMVLPADKGKCLVVMDRKDYIEKMETKLQDETTYIQTDIERPNQPNQRIPGKETRRNSEERRN